MDNICGIYEIKNIVNNKVYIGQSRNIHKRWNSHINELRNNKHHNYHLQQSWNKYGEENFQFSLLNVCEEHELNQLEAEHISLANAMDSDYGYNIRYVDEDNVYSFNEEGLRHLSEAHEFQFRPVNQYDDYKKKIHRYKNIKVAVRETTLEESGIRNDAMFNSNHKKLRKYKGYYWIFDDDCEWFEKCDLQRHRDLSKFKVNKYCFPSGKFICQYNSIKEAAIDNNVTIDVISMCIRQVQNHSNGFTYRNADDYEHGIDIQINYQKNQNHFRRPVLCIDTKTGFVIKEYSSIQKAKDDGFNTSHISEVCNGKRKTSDGYLWKYKEV